METFLYGFRSRDETSFTSFLRMKNHSVIIYWTTLSKSLNDLDNQSFKKPKFNQRDEDPRSKSGSSPNCKDKRDNLRKNSGNQRRNNRKREYKVPEHVKNPSKFKKYDLSDVRLTDGKVSYLQSDLYDLHCSKIHTSFFVQK